jgi:hypothetical protein
MNSCLAIAVACSAMTAVGALQQSLQERRAAQSANAEKQGLAEPFKGITSNGTVVPNLFGIRSTGVSTANVQRAAGAFSAP